MSMRGASLPARQSSRRWVGTCSAPSSTLPPAGTAPGPRSGACTIRSRCSIRRRLPELSHLGQNVTTPRIDSPRFISSNASLIFASGITCVIIGSIWIFPCMYHDLQHVGASARAAKGGALPDAPGDELERPQIEGPREGEVMVKI